MKKRPKDLRRAIEHAMDELKQLITDAQSWNDNRPDAEPMDVGVYLVDLSIARRAIEKLDAGDPDGAASVMEELIARIETESP